MLVFLATEFITLAAPHLLSIGMATEAGHEFYAELDLKSDVGRLRVAASTEFVKEHVLSQWSGKPDTGISEARMGVRASIWLYSLAEHFGQNIDLLYGNQVDADLLESALRSSNKWWPRVETRVHWSIVSYCKEQPAFRGAMNESWDDSLFLDGLRRHHALADARAFRAGFSAVHGRSSEAQAVAAGIREAVTRKKDLNAIPSVPAEIGTLGQKARSAEGSGNILPSTKPRCD